MKQILVVAEKDSKKLRAFLRAVAFAKATGAQIDLVGFVHAPGIDGSDLLSEKEKNKVKQTLIDEKKALIQSVIDKTNVEGITIDWNVLWEKSVHDWVINRCKQKPYDLVIKTGNRSESLSYTPTDWHLIRSNSAPVMIMTNEKWKAKNCILATVDLNTDTAEKIKLNKMVIEQAQALAAITGQTIKYLHCITLPRVIADLDIIDESKLSKNGKAKALEHLGTHYKKFNIDPKSVIIKRGGVDTIINKTAKSESADIVIMGTIGRKGIKGKLIGNTAESVLSKLQTDVLTVKA